MLRQMFKGCGILSFQSRPVRRPYIFTIDGLVSLSSVKRPTCIESLCSIVLEYRGESGLCLCART